MNAEHIPFVNSVDDCKLLKKYYSDSFVIRISLFKRADIANHLPAESRIWCDAAVDGLDKEVSGADTRYLDFVKQFSGYNQIWDPEFHKKPKKEVVTAFVRQVMDECCAEHRPDWLSIPQLPIIRDTSRNKVNRALARAAGEWKASQKFSGKFILPVILTHQDQTKLKTKQRAPLSLIKSCYEAAGADGVWVTDHSLNDQDGSGPLGRRFQGLIDFHQEMNTRLPSDAVKIAGPYWGINLVLWARGLINFPAIGLGNAYRYYVPGGFPGKSPKKYLAIPSLKRRAIASLQLESWFKDALTRIPSQETAHQEMEQLLQHCRQPTSDSRSQVAEFYRTWFNQLAAVPSNGRALALYQQLSSAYVLGKSLSDLTDEKGRARRPERVAQQLMLSCL